MARPEIPSEEKKSVRIPAYFTERIAGMILQLSKKNDQSKGSYIREAAITRVKKEMWNQKTLI